MLNECQAFFDKFIYGSVMMRLYGYFAVVGRDVRLIGVPMRPAAWGYSSGPPQMLAFVG